MASLHYRKDSNRWRVQVRHLGYKTISLHFDTKKEALAFKEIIESKMSKKLQSEAMIKALNLVE